MNTPTSFFIQGPSNDLAYVNVRDLPRNKDARSFVEELWMEYRDIADRHFLNDAKEHFLQRFWEMYVAVTLKKKEMEPVKVSNEGPEFYFQHENRRVWVEAVAPGPGDGSDAVTESPHGDVPEESVILRYTNALAEKLKQYKQAVEKGIVAADDHYIIALNCRRIPYAPTGRVLPYGVMACLPFGQLMCTVDKETMKVVNSHFASRDQVVKKNGSAVETNPFLNSSYKGITGLLHSAVDPVNRPEEMGGDFWFLHNPSARAPFGKSPFQFCQQYFYEEPNIRRVEPKNSM